jgi:hypothetical protein
MKELKPSASDSRLGRDFWVFQTGQTISTVGGSCGNIALALVDSRPHSRPE